MLRPDCFTPASSTTRGALKSRPVGRKSAVKGILRSGTSGLRIGEDIQSGERFDLSRSDQFCHSHIIGMSGSGKSVLMEYQIRQILSNPAAGLCLIDPHGSLYHAVLHYLSHKRPDLASRVVLFSPAEEHEMVVGFNPIGRDAVTDPVYALNSVISAVLKAWGQDNTDRTPRITRWLENIFATIITNRLTILETLPLLSTRRQNAHRDRLIAAVKNDLIREDWMEFIEAQTRTKQEYLEGAQNRFRKFLRNPFLRQIFGQQEKVLDIPRIVAEKKILLVNLASNTNIDRDNNRLIGTLLVNEFFRAALLRDPDGLKRRSAPFYLFLDEFAQFVTPEIAYALEECRKFQLFLTLAHQHLGQLKRDDEYLYASVLTNCKNRYVFGLSYEDAEILSQEIHTGYENLLRVKYEHWSTKFRPVEETRDVHSKGRSTMQGFSENVTKSVGYSSAIGGSLAQSATRSHTESSGSSHQTGRSHALSTGSSLAEQNGTSASHAETRGESSGVSHQNTTSSTQGRTDSSSRSDSRQHGQSAAYGFQEGSGKSADFRGSSEHISASEGFSRSESNSKSVGDSVSQGESRSRSNTLGETTGTNTSRNRAETDTHGISHGSTVSRNHSRQNAEQETNGVQRGISEGIALGESRTENRSQTASEQESQGQSTSESVTENESVSVVPFHRMEEFQESMKTFWSLEEIKHMQIGEIKNQETAVAHVKLGSLPPVQVRVDYVESPPFSKRYSPRLLAKFRQKVYRASPHYYATRSEAILEIETRQRAVFDTVLEFDLTAPPEEKTNAITAETCDVDDRNNLFED